MELRLNSTETAMVTRRRWSRASFWIMCLLVACVLSGLFDLAAASEFTGERWAVVIGVAEYKNEDLRLPYADRDADEFYKFLLSAPGGAFPEDHIRKLTNEQVTLSSLRSALGTFLQQAKPEDYVVIYLSGHGLPDPRNTKKFYFLSSQSNLNDLAGSAVEMSEVFKWVSEVQAGRKLLITDDCHSGALGTAGAAKGPNRVNAFLRRLAQSYEGLVVLTSSEGYQLSQIYTEKKHSYFTYFLLRALQEDASQVDGRMTGTKDGVVDSREAYEWVREQVMKATGNAQIPDKGGDLGLRIPLAIVPRTPGTGTVAAVPTPSPPRSPKPPPVQPAPPSAPPVEKARAPAYQPPAPPPSEIVGWDGALMILIPKGEFQMGRYGDKDNPPRRISLRNYCIDKYEVTVARYAKYLADTGAPEGVPKDWGDAKPGVHGDRPVAGVNQHDAFNYCSWAGKRLPDDEEWEKAARGMDGRIYPWGNNPPQVGMSNFNQNDCWFCNVYDDQLASVGYYEQDRSPYGVFDMAGNVSEWVYSGSTVGPLRGGNWHTERRFMELARITSKYWHARAPDQGFRCAMDVPIEFLFGSSR